MPLKLNTASNGSVTIDAANTASNFTLTVPAQTGTAIIANSDGNVGIGTSSPSYRLEVSAGDTTAGIGYATRIRGNSTANAGAIQWTDSGATAQWGYLAVDSSFNMKFGGASSERMRMDSSGNLLLSLEQQYYGMNQYTNKRFMNFSYPPSGQFGGNFDSTDIRTPGNGSALVQMRVTQQGNVGCRGTFSGGQTLNDYAEYFEWSDGNPNNEDRIGQTVVLDNGKVRPSTSEDAPHTIIGVVSATAGVVLGSAPFEWSGKYKKDEFGRIITQSETWINWTDESGSHNYKQGEVPADIVVPENAEIRTYQKEVLSENYDESVDYTNREARPEWACIGLVGQVHVKKGQVVGDRWIKMKDVSENVEMWFIR